MSSAPKGTQEGARSGAQAKEHSFRGDIQGIRALGLAMVLLTHAEVSELTGGFVGLDAFFVISGFLITGLLIDEMERTGSLSLLKFYARRVRRLLPLAIFVLFAVVVGSALLFSPVRNDQVAGDVIAASFYFVNWRFAAQSVDYFAANPFESPIQHFWSLSVEEQFYLVWPTLLLAALAWYMRNPDRRSLRRGLWVLVLSTGLTSLYYSAFVVDTSTASYSYFSTIARVWEFSLGAALALLLPKRLELPGALVALLSWGGVLALVGAAFLFDPSMPYPGTAALLPCLATAAIVVAGTTTVSALPTRMLASGPFRYVGDISYAWYLWHWPAIVFAETAWGPLTTPEMLAVTAAAFVPTLASHYLIEQPFRYSRPLARRPRWAVGFGFACMAASVGLAAGLMAVQPTVRTASGDSASFGAPAAERGEAFQPEADALRPPPREAKDDRGRAYEDGCLVEQTDLEGPKCVYGKRDSAKQVVLFGNSHALHYAPPIRRIANRRGWRLRTLMRAGCPMADIQFAYRCDTWREQTLERIERIRPDMVIVATTTEYRFGVVEDGERLSLEASRPYLEDGLVRTLERLQATGARVVLLGDLPRSDEDVPECVSRATDALEECAFPDRRPPDRGSDVRAARRVDGVGIVDPTPLLCPKRRCPAVIGNALVYRDTNHFTATFARTLAPWLARKLPDVPERTASTG